jgi:hypothetical protein
MTRSEIVCARTGAETRLARRGNGVTAWTRRDSIQRAVLKRPGVGRT